MGIRDIAADIKIVIKWKGDAIFHNGDSGIMILVWKGICVVPRGKL